MLKAIEAYLALRRATGFAMLNAECLLKSFAAFATERAIWRVAGPVLKPIRCSSTHGVCQCATSRSKKLSTGWSAGQASYRRRGAERVCTICGTRSRCACCKAAPKIETDAMRTWLHLRPTWVTSTSMRPTGIWKPPPTSCATSPRPVKGSSPRGGRHDADCSPYRSVPQ